MFTLELARRQHVEGGRVTANVIDPFLVRAGLTQAKDVPVLFKLARPLMWDASIELTTSSCQPAIGRT